MSCILENFWYTGFNVAQYMNWWDWCKHTLFLNDMLGVPLDGGLCEGKDWWHTSLTRRLCEPSYFPSFPPLWLRVHRILTALCSSDYFSVSMTAELERRCSLVLDIPTHWWGRKQKGVAYREELNSLWRQGKSPWNSVPLHSSWKVILGM